MGNWFKPVLGGLSVLKEMTPYINMPMCSDKINNQANQQEARDSFIVGSNKKIYIYSNSMRTNRNELIRWLLPGITNDELQNLVQVREEVRRYIPTMRGGEARRPIPTPRRRTHTPAPRKMGVNQLIRYFENKPIPPYRRISAPRTKKQQPVPAPRTKISEKRRALKGFTKSYETGLKSDRDALVHLQNTRLAISRLFGTILNNTKGFKSVETLKSNIYEEKG